MKSPTPALAATVALMLTAAVASQTACRVMLPVRTSSDLRTSLPGRLVADQSLSLRARVTGYITKLTVDHGSKVVQGALLATIDAPELKAALATAKAALSEANASVSNAEAQQQLARSRVAEAEGGIVVAEAALVDRSAGEAELGVPFYPLVSLNFPVFDADAVPPELAAIPATKPGSRKN